MRVVMSTIFKSIQENLQDLAGDLQRINTSISSGRKYQNISENPVEVGEILGLNGDLAQLSQYKRNLETAQDWLGVSESTLQNVNDLVRGAMALANQMATGTYNAAQRQAAASQIQGMLEEAMQVGNTEYNGQYILSGYKTDTRPFELGAWDIQAPVMRLQTGSTGQATSSGTYTGTTTRSYLVEIVNGGATGTATFRVSEDGGQTWSSPGVTGINVPIGSHGVEVTFANDWISGDRFYIPVFQPIGYQGDQNNLELGIGRQSRLVVNEVGSQVLGGTGAGNDVFRLLAQLKSSLEANDSAGAGDSLESLGLFQAQLTSTLAGLGASINRVSTKDQMYLTLAEELTADVSKKGDTDLVEAVNALKSKEVAYQAALLASSKVMQMSLIEYL